MKLTLKELLLGKNPVSRLRAMIANNQLATFEPYLQELKMEIPKGYHHKDNLEHSLRVLQNAIHRESDGVDLILRTAALLHDIGKPATRKFEGKGKVTFQNHENAGANIARKILPHHGYTKKEIREICTLISLHMRAHGYDEDKWTDSSVRRLMADAGNSETLFRLIIIFYADATTKNQTLLRKHHASVERLESEIRRVAQEDSRKALRPALNGNEVMELLGIPAGRELGAVMKFLNSDEGIYLRKEDAIEEVLKRFQ